MNDTKLAEMYQRLQEMSRFKDNNVQVVDEDYLFMRLKIDKYLHEQKKKLSNDLKNKVFVP
jgi:hypothetical protein